MKFRISKEKFLEGLQQVQNVVSSRATLPILSNVLIEADRQELRFTTTDLDIVVSGRISSTGDDDIGLQILEPGAITLPVRRLASIVRELPASEVEVTVSDENTAAIKCGNSFFKILGLPPDDFPPPPRFEDVKEYKITQKTMRDALKKTAYAISTDETRYVLNGIYCQFKEGKMTLVATDGRRLAMTDVDVEFPESHEVSVIVPTKAVNELQRLLKDDGHPYYSHEVAISHTQRVHLHLRQVGGRQAVHLHRPHHEGDRMGEQHPRRLYGLGVEGLAVEDVHVADLVHQARLAGATAVGGVAIAFKRELAGFRLQHGGFGRRLRNDAHLFLRHGGSP